MSEEARTTIGTGAKTAHNILCTSTKRSLKNPSLTYVNNVKQRLKTGFAKLKKLKKQYLRLKYTVHFNYKPDNDPAIVELTYFLK